MCPAQLCRVSGVQRRGRGHCTSRACTSLTASRARRAGTDLAQALTAKDVIARKKQAMSADVAKALARISSGLYVVTAGHDGARSAMIASWVSQVRVTAGCRRCVSQLGVASACVPGRLGRAWPGSARPRCARARAPGRPSTLRGIVSDAAEPGARWYMPMMERQRRG